MKQAMLSKKNSTYLFDHVLDGFKSSHEGIEQLQQQGLIQPSEYIELHKKNATRLIDRIKEFKLHTRLISVFFAVLFSWMQVNGDDLDMRRSSRVRTRTSTARGTKGGRRNEGEVIAI